MALAELRSGLRIGVFNRSKEQPVQESISSEYDFDQARVDAVAKFLEAPIVTEFMYHDYGENKPNRSFAHTDRLIEDKRNYMSFEPGVRGMYDRLKIVLSRKIR